eukprot:2090802-Rhodomonas_salina.1
MIGQAQGDSGGQWRPAAGFGSGAERPSNRLHLAGHLSRLDAACLPRAPWDGRRLRSARKTVARRVWRGGVCGGTESTGRAWLQGSELATWVLMLAEWAGASGGCAVLMRGWEQRESNPDESDQPPI